MDLRDENFGCDHNLVKMALRRNDLDVPLNMRACTEVLSTKTSIVVNIGHDKVLRAFSTAMASRTLILGSPLLFIPAAIFSPIVHGAPAIDSLPSDENMMTPHPASDASVYKAALFIGGELLDHLRGGALISASAHIFQ